MIATKPRRQPCQAGDPTGNQVTKGIAASPSRVPPRSTTRRNRSLIGAQAERLRGLSIESIDDPTFGSARTRREIEVAHAADVAPNSIDGHPGTHPAGGEDAPLLTKQQEFDLFRRMNFLKCRANELRQRLEPAQATQAEVEAIERLLAEAVTLRNRIMIANLRLVISVAKHYVDDHVTFSDLVSEGNVSLLRAIEKFDYTRGFRFSTYATWALRFNFNRLVATQRTRRRRFVHGDEALLETPAVDSTSEPSEAQRTALKLALRKMLARLDGRERTIILSRFGLEKGAAAHTLQQIAGQIGVCKERVRQIEIRALDKLRGLARAAHIEPPSVY